MTERSRACRGKLVVYIANESSWQCVECGWIGWPRRQQDPERLPYGIWEPHTLVVKGSYIQRLMIRTHNIEQTLPPDCGSGTI